LPGDPPVELRLSLDEADALHAALEELLEGGREDPRLERSYRVLGWRILAARRRPSRSTRLQGSGRWAPYSTAWRAPRTGTLEKP
jgi:hypothetical protein